MRWLAAVLLVASMTLAGCTDGGADAADTASDDEAFSDLGFDASSTTGVIRGLVIDEAIRPVEGATVRLLADPPRETSSDADGRFGFGDVPPGTYDVEAELLNHEPATVQVLVEAGIDAPPIIKLQLMRLWSQEPMSEIFQFQGFLNCAWEIGTASPCVTDFTRLDFTGTCPGGCFPALANNLGLDQREFIKEVPNGWQTMVFEMTWEPSVGGTADAMQMHVSTADRKSTHWFASHGSKAPLRMEMVQGVPHAGASFAEPVLIAPEGIPNMLTFMNAAVPPGEQPSVAVVVQQDFEVILTTFIWGHPPEGWSFMAGDERPF